MIPAGLHLVDTSAIARASHAGVQTELVRLGRLGLLATCATVDLEVLYSARSPAEYATISQLRSAGFVDLPLHHDIGERAKTIQAMLAIRSQHRAAGVFDILTAAIAEHYAAVIVHYDSDFEHIAAVTGQHIQWVVPRGAAG